MDRWNGVTAADLSLVLSDNVTAGAVAGSKGKQLDMSRMLC
jgi:hypothetical protein